MPELGETWSVVETAKGQSRIEAVVIATGPTMVRLVTRSGRRITFPTPSFGLSWSLVTAAPADGQTCRNCRQAAFFRHTVGGQVVWVCEDHVPSGARAYFPGDTPGAPGLDFTCPLCESKQVSFGSQLISLANDRTTTRLTCTGCHISWSTLIGRGLADDGTTLAVDLARMIDNDPTISDIWSGFVAYRNLCRAVGMGDVAHIRGVPIESKASCPDLMTLVFFDTKPPSAGTQASATSEPSLAFGAQFQTREVKANTEWRRLRRTPTQVEARCKIVSVSEGVVVYERVEHDMIGGNIIRMVTAELDVFLDHWTPSTLLTDPPPEWTIWRQGETGLLVQVVAATKVQAANNQVAFMTVAGERATTPVATFRRLYKELPTPPEQHLWFRDGTLFEVDRTDAGLLAIRPHGVPGDADQIGCATLYQNYEPLVLVEVFDDHAASYPTKALRSGYWWRSKTDPVIQICLLDIGVVSSQCHFVRYIDGDAKLRCQALASFLSTYDYVPPNLPCKAGETWVSLTDPSKQGVIVDEEIMPDVALVRWQSGATGRIPHDELTEGYRRLDIRSYWEFLSEEEED